MNKRRLAHVKWAGPNTPYIRMISDDRRLYLSKRELSSLRDEIDAFISYYDKDFAEGRIDIEDESYEPFEPTSKEEYPDSRSG